MFNCQLIFIEKHLIVTLVCFSYNICERICTMNIGNIIKDLRIKKKYTQEQLAKFVGVSAPAVNKWENGNSVPDVTLLPVIARVLDTDINTLLDFNKEMTVSEVADFMNLLVMTMQKEGYEKAYKVAENKIKEYPTCDLLMFNCAMILDSGIMMFKPKADEAIYREYTEGLYRKVAESGDLNMANQAKSVLITKALEKKEYEKAADILMSIKDVTAVDKKGIRAKIDLALGDFDDAAKATEEQLFMELTKIQGLLMNLCEIAFRSGRTEDAEIIADVNKNFVENFDLMPYIKHNLTFMLNLWKKEKQATIAAFDDMIKCCDEKYDMNSSPLFRHINQKNNEGMENIKRMLIKSVLTDTETDFIKDEIKNKY